MLAHKKYSRKNHLLSTVSLFALSLCASAQFNDAQAATITVTTNADSGAGSLRAAINSANPGDTIAFSLAPNSTITLSSALPGISQNLTIDGSGSSGLTISGASTAHVFQVGYAYFNSSSSVTIENLTIANGSASGGNGAAGGTRDGGGGGGLGAGGGLQVLDNSNVSLVNITFNNNNAAGGTGGAGGSNVDASGAGGNGANAFSVQGGLGGAAGATGAAGGNAFNLSVGTGGGGGGGSFGGTVGGTGGTGGFGGGGGGSGSSLIGFVGGGTAGTNGGIGGYGVQNGGGGGGGGGGALGGAIFVNDQAFLSLTNVSVSGSSVTAGSGGAQGAGAGAGAAGSTDGTGIFSRNTGFATTFGGGTYSDQIGGTGGVGITSGTTTFTHSNDYTGNTVITGGSTLIIGNDNALGDIASTVTFNSGTLKGSAAITSSRTMTLTGNGTIDSNGFNDSLSGAIGGVGKLLKTGSGTLTLSNASNNWSGGTEVDAGTLSIGSVNNIGTGGIAFNGGTLKTTADVSTSQAVTLTGNGTVDTSSFSDTLSGNIGGAGKLFKSGSGTLTLTGTNNYTGGTEIDGGTLSVGTGTLGTGGITFNGDNVVLQTTGAISNSNGITLTTAGTIDTDGHNDAFSGTVSGSGKLFKAGAGTLALSGTNNATGGTEIDGGTLSVGSDSLATGGLTFNNANAILQTTGAVTTNQAVTLTTDGTFDTDNQVNHFSGNFTGAGKLIVTDSSEAAGGFLVLSGTNNYTGGTLINNGATLAVDTNSLGTGGITFNQGTLKTTSVQTTSQAITLTGNGTINTGIFDDTFSGAITGAGELFKKGPGKLTLTNAGNNWTGGTEIDQGILSIGAMSNLGTGGITLNNGTLQTTGALTNSQSVTLTGNGTVDTDGHSDTFSGNMGGTGKLLVVDSSMSNNGNLILTGTSNNYTGGTEIDSGDLTISSGSNLGTGGITFGGGLLKTSADLTTNENITMNATGEVDTLGHSVTFSGAFSGSHEFVIADNTGDHTGVAILSGDNSSYSGAWSVDNATLSVSSTNNLGTGLIDLSNTATLRTTGDTTVNQNIVFDGDLFSPPTITIDTQNGNTTTVSGNLTGSANNHFFKIGDGTLLINSANSSAFTSDTTVNAGSLAIGDISHSSASIASDVLVNSGGTLLGHGTIVGNVTNTGGHVTPGGSIGTLTINGAFSQDSSGTTTIEVSPTAASKLQISGGATLAGTLAVSYNAGTYHATTYDILSASSITGQFTTVSTYGVPAGFISTITYTATDVDLNLILAAPSGASPFSNVSHSEVTDSYVVGEMVLRHLEDIRSGVGNETHSAFNGQPIQLAFNGDNSQLAGMLASAPDLVKDGMWIKSIGSWNHVGTNDGISGFSSSTSGVITGVDKHVSDDAVVGIAAAYTHSNISQHNGYDDGNGVDTPRIAIYGSYALDGINLDGAVDYAYHHVTASRYISTAGTTATSKHDENEADLSLKASRLIGIDRYRVTPSVGFDYAHLHQQSFSEEGAGTSNMNVFAQDFNSLRPFVGVGTSTRFIADDTSIIPEVRAKLSHEALDNSYSGTGSILGANYVLNGASAARDTVSLGGGVAVIVDSTLDVFADYDADLHAGNGGGLSQTIAGGLKLKF